MRAASALLAGVLFGGGLIISGMTRPAKIIGFLDLWGHWDPSLLLVMVGALFVHGVLLRLVVQRPAPLFDTIFHLPTRRAVDVRLLLGSALFGIGWGLGGYCPGPAITSLAAGLLPIVFVATMLGGIYVHEMALRKRSGM